MSQRQENIRKSCDEINEYLELFNKRKIPFHVFYSKVKDLAHRIKRTTWRGEGGKSKSDICLSHSLSKRLNTNQTTTANIDVSTIPYY